MQKKYRLGVLFVHGIGQQGRGDTLVRFGEPIADWLRRWLGGSGSDGFDRVRVGTARVAEDPLDLAAPAHAELEILPAADGEEGTAKAGSWLLAESWWAQRFITPSYRDLASWGCQILPWTLAFHFATRARRAWAEIRDRRRGQRLLAVARFVIEMLKLLLAILLFPLLAFVVLLILVIGALPLPKVRAVVGAFQRLLSSTLGDIFVLLSSPIQEAAIVAQVKRDLAWLAGRCHKVAVVAHSQGAALAHQVLRTRPTDKLARFITLGSGLGKLEEIRAISRVFDRWDLWLAPAGLLLLAYSLLRLVRELRAGSEDYFAWIFFGLIGLAFGATGATRLRRENRPPPQELRLPGEAEWLDLYSSSDLVPNGRLLDSDTETRKIMKPVEVRNLASLVVDHGSYWRNADEFVSRVAEDLVAAAELDLVPDRKDDPARLRAAGHRRRWRVRWLVAARLAVTALAVALAARLWDSFALLDSPLRDSLKALSRLVPLAGFLEGKMAVGGATAVSAGLAAILALSGLVYALLYGLWSVWNRVEIEGFFRRRAIAPFGGSFVTFAFAVVVVLEAATLVALGLGPGLVSALWTAGGLALGLFILCLVAGAQIVVALVSWMRSRGWIGPSRGPYFGKAATAAVMLAVLALPRFAWVAAQPQPAEAVQPRAAPGAAADTQPSEGGPAAVATEEAGAGAAESAKRWLQLLKPRPIRAGMAVTNWYLLGLLAAIVVGSWLLYGRLGHLLSSAFSRWSRAEPATVVLARHAAEGPEAEETRALAVLRADQLIYGLGQLDGYRETYGADAAKVEILTRERAAEANLLADVLALPAPERSDELRRLYAPHSAAAALALARAETAEAPGSVVEILESHRDSGPRWQRRQVRRALGRLRQARATA